MNKKTIIQKWKEKNGAADFDLKNRDIILYDGGLFSIEAKKIKGHKIIGYKKLPDGNVQILFSKKKCINDVDYRAYLWFEELDETIRYLKRMKRMLNKIGYKTDLRYKI